MTSPAAPSSASVTPGPEITPAARRRAFVGAIAGHLIEWYDYGVYGFMAVYVAKNFFASQDPLVGLLSTFAIFALSFFIRPLGGLVFGPLADRIGRRKTLMLVLALMCGSTMLIGALPTVHSVGVLAPVLLVALRLVQGFSAGGEVSTITAFIAEFARRGGRGLATSFLMMTAASGLLLGALVGNGLTWALGPEAMTAWGWRLPFLVAGPLGFIAILIRMRLEDSPEFTALKAQDQLAAAPLREVLRYPRQLWLTMAVITLLGSSFYLVLTYMTTYLTTVVKLGPGTTFTYVLLTGALGAALMPVGGMITDRLGSRRPFMLGVAVFLGVAAVWFFRTAPGATPAQLLPPLLAVAVGFGLYCGVPYATMSELLPTSVRSTGIAIGYNVPVAVFGGSAPFIASWLIGTTKDPSSPGWFFAATAVISIIGLLFLRDEDLLGKDPAALPETVTGGAPRA